MSKFIKGVLNLKVLHLHHTSLVELPNNFGDLEHLVELNLEGCQSLNSLPKNFSRLNTLKVFNLEDCTSLRMLGSNFRQLWSLLKLDISFYPIQSNGFPLGFGGLCSLSILDMLGNHLTRLPMDFNSLIALVHLEVDKYLWWCLL